MIGDLSLQLRPYLLTQSGVTDLVATRIYPDKTPQNPTRPCIVYRQTDSDYKYVHPRDVDLAILTYEFECQASSSLGARALAHQVRISFHAMIGVFGDMTIINSRLGKDKDGVTDDTLTHVVTHEVVFTCY